MKKILILLIGVLTLASCGGNNSKKDYNASINGTAAGMGNADVKLIYYKGTRAVTLDSVTMKEGIFKIGDNVEEPKMVYLKVSGIPSDLPLILEKGSDIKVDINSKHMRKSSVISDGLNKKLYDYFDKLMMFRDKQDKLGKLYQAADKKGTEAEKTNIINRYYAIDDEKHTYEYDFISKNNDNLVGSMIFEAMAYDKAEPNYNKLAELYKSFPDKIKQMPNVKHAYEDVVKVKSATSIGSKAPDFSAATPNGKTLSLSDVTKGAKVTVIDFWASWCRPCRGENPFVVEIYKKYHDKGLNIIGVSLDKPGNKDAWVKAIKDDKLPWQHVSNLKYWQDPIAKDLYHVQSIPQTFILDKNGVIRAKNLRRDRLEQKIKELIEEK